MNSVPNTFQKYQRQEKVSIHPIEGHTIYLANPNENQIVKNISQDGYDVVP